MNKKNVSMVITAAGLVLIGTGFLKRKEVPLIITDEPWPPKPDDGEPIKTEVREETVIQIDVKYIETAIEALKMAEEKSKSPEFKAIYRDSIDNLDIVAKVFRES